VLVFAFYQFHAAPLSFNSALISDVRQSAYKDSIQILQQKTDSLNSEKQQKALAFTKAIKENKKDALQSMGEELKSINAVEEKYRNQFKSISKKVSDKYVNDTNYIFLSFVKQYLPAGLKGLLIATIFLAAWGSIAAALNSLASSTVIDFHKRYARCDSELQEYQLSKKYTLIWGCFSILVAQFSYKLGQSLIEAVNVLGSLFYGVILGIFLVAFYAKPIKGRATFWAALIVEIFVVLLFFNEQIPFLSFLPDISFLWLNAIGAIGLVLLAWLLQLILPELK
jgi:uncharacterized sodium:solute symporter family permease YidK